MLRIAFAAPSTTNLQDIDDLVHSANLPSGVTFDSLFELEALMIAFQDKMEQMTEEPQKIRFVLSY